MTAELQKMRRTQRERRESTIARILDGTISALADLGYGRSTIKEICERAGVSQGALFRHFRTRSELMAAAAEEVADRQISSFIEEHANEPVGDDPLSTTLRMVQRRARNPVNAVWYELLAAARTDPELRVAIVPIASDYVDQVQEIAAQHPALANFPPDLLPAAIRLLLYVVGGAAILDVSEPDPDKDEKTLQLLVSIFKSANGSPIAASSRPSPRPRRAAKRR